MPIEFVVKEELSDLLNSELSVIDKTIEIVLYVMKKQLFLDGNKRTAILFANHYLISHGEGIIVVPAELVSKYKIHLIAYYEDRDTMSIKEFLKNNCWIKLK